MLAGAGAGTGESLGEGMLFHSIFRGLIIRLITEHTELPGPNPCTEGVGGGRDRLLNMEPDTELKPLEGV